MKTATLYMANQKNTDESYIQRRTNVFIQKFGQRKIIFDDRFTDHPNGWTISEVLTENNTLKDKFLKQARCRVYHPYINFLAAKHFSESSDIAINFDIVGLILLFSKFSNYDDIIEVRPNSAVKLGSQWTTDSKQPFAVYEGIIIGKSENQHTVIMDIMDAIYIQQQVTIDKPSRIFNFENFNNDKAHSILVPGIKYKDIISSIRYSPGYQQWPELFQSIATNIVSENVQAKRYQALQDHTVSIRIELWRSMRGLFFLSGFVVESGEFFVLNHSALKNFSPGGDRGTLISFDESKKWIVCVVGKKARLSESSMVIDVDLTVVVYDLTIFSIVKKVKLPVYNGKIHSIVSVDSILYIIALKYGEEDDSFKYHLECCNLMDAVQMIDLGELPLGNIVPQGNNILFNFNDYIFGKCDSRTLTVGICTKRKFLEYDIESKSWEEIDID
eukprot:480946_1